MRHRTDIYLPLLIAALIGALAGLAAIILSKGVGLLGSMRVQMAQLWPPYMVLPLIGLSGGAIAGLMVQKLAPQASGSGIPQVRACLDRLLMPLNIRIALVKLVSGTIALGSGFFMGREGPTVQLGAALAAPLSKLQAGARHRRELIAAGAAAGLTAAFNAPLAGITFALEELLKEIKPTTILFTATACAISCYVLNLLSPPHMRLPLSPLKDPISFAPQDIPFYFLLAVTAGIIGAEFNKLILVSLAANRKSGLPLFCRTALAGMLSGLLISLLPANFQNYAELRALTIGGEMNLHTSVTAFFSFLFLTLLAYGSGAPGGLFAPTLTLGSNLGYLIGLGEFALNGTTSTTAFSLVGMGTLFSAVARTPLTAVVITFELTNKPELILPLLFTSLLSTAVAESISSGGLYDKLMQWSGLAWEQKTSAKDIVRVHQLMDIHAPKVKPDITLKEALKLERSGETMAVVQGNALIGLLHPQTLRSEEELARLTVSDVMESSPLTLSINDRVEEVLAIFSSPNIESVAVQCHGEFAGILHRRAIIDFLSSGAKIASPD